MDERGRAVGGRGGCHVCAVAIFFVFRGGESNLCRPGYDFGQAGWVRQILSLMFSRAGRKRAFCVRARDFFHLVTSTGVVVLLGRVKTEPDSIVRGGGPGGRSAMEFVFCFERIGWGAVM